MLERILIDMVVTLAAIALLSGSPVGCFWLRDAPEAAKRRKAAAGLVAGLVAQKKALDALGDVDFDTAGLTLAQLNQELNEPTQVSVLMFSNDKVLGKSELLKVSSSKALARRAG